MKRTAVPTHDKPTPRAAGGTSRAAAAKWLLLATWLPWCWLAMMAVHELGHVAAARVTGGEVARVVLHPLEISRTELRHNPRPLVVAAAGPVVGCLLPLAAWGLWRAARLPDAHLLRFFAGFCLVANGAYLLGGTWTAAGDAADLLRHGAPAWLIWLSSAAAAAGGLYLWNGLGPAFGIGPRAQPVPLRTSAVSLILLLATVAAMLVAR